MATDTEALDRALSLLATEAGIEAEIEAELRRGRGKGMFEKVFR